MGSVGVTLLCRLSRSERAIAIAGEAAPQVPGGPWANMEKNNWNSLSFTTTTKLMAWKKSGRNLIYITGRRVMRELSSAEISMVSGAGCATEVAGYVVASASLTVASGPVGWGLAIGGWALSAYSAQECLDSGSGGGGGSSSSGGGGGDDVYIDEFGCHQTS